MFAGNQERKLQFSARWKIYIQYSMAGTAGCNRPFSVVSIQRDNLQHMILLPDHSPSQSEQLLSYRISNTR